MTEWKEKAFDTIKDEITFTKLDLCLIVAVCFLAGACIGMIIAPFTHGISLFSHNGSNNGNCGNHDTAGDGGNV